MYMCRDVTELCVSFVILTCEENIPSPTYLRGLWEIYEKTRFDVFSKYFLNVSHDRSCALGTQGWAKDSAPHKARSPGWVSSESWAIETKKELTRPWGHARGFVLLPRFHWGGYPVRHGCAWPPAHPVHQGCSWPPAHCHWVTFKMTGSNCICQRWDNSPWIWDGTLCKIR